MSTNRFPAWVAVLWVVVSVSGGCASEPELLPLKSADVPAGLDLSGRWRMQDDYRAMQRRIDRAIRQTDGVDDRIVPRPQRVSRNGRRVNRDVGGLVHVFLENARSLRITQTKDGLFVGFDRSVVEEYRFGEARRVSVGGATARRVSGWEQNGYVVETLGDAGMKLTERYRLEADGRQLVREIVLRSKDMERVAIVQTYARVGS